jgi:hypothetical protein
LIAVEAAQAGDHRTRFSGSVRFGAGA